MVYLRSGKKIVQKHVVKGRAYGRITVLLPRDMIGKEVEYTVVYRFMPDK